ncbi:MAG: YopX family protein [Firmicutes bacterium]|nr:YopX family protein [Bacillota bacterium]
MREIKFRVLDGFSNWHFSNDIGIGIFFDRLDYDFQEETLGQYTGLKDQKGIEIWEGDILKATRETPTFDSRIKGYVEYSDAHACWVLVIKKGIEFLPLHQLFDLEKVGNIHDNPEMIS